jgi:hypothetical protein
MATFRSLVVEGRRSAQGSRRPGLLDHLSETCARDSIPSTIQSDGQITRKRESARRPGNPSVRPSFTTAGHATDLSTRCALRESRSRPSGLLSVSWALVAGECPRSLPDPSSRSSVPRPQAGESVDYPLLRADRRRQFADLSMRRRRTEAFLTWDKGVTLNDQSWLETS